VVTKTGWRDEKANRKRIKQIGHLKNTTSAFPELQLTISSLKDVGIILSLYSRIIYHI
jgi:hypothetical protein